MSSAGEDGSVCLWKYNDLSLVFEQDAHQVISLKHTVTLCTMSHYIIFLGTKNFLFELVFFGGEENFGFI